MLNDVILFFHILILCAPPSVYSVYNFLYTYCICIHSETRFLPECSSYGFFLFFLFFFPFYL